MLTFQGHWNLPSSTADQVAVSEHVVHHQSPNSSSKHGMSKQDKLCSFTSKYVIFHWTMIVGRRGILLTTGLCFFWWDSAPKNLGRWEVQSIKVSDWNGVIIWALGCHILAATYAASAMSHQGGLWCATGTTAATATATAVSVSRMWQRLLAWAQRSVFFSFLVFGLRHLIMKRLSPSIMLLLLLLQLLLLVLVLDSVAHLRSLLRNATWMCSNWQFFSFWCYIFGCLGPGLFPFSSAWLRPLRTFKKGLVLLCCKSSQW